MAHTSAGQAGAHGQLRSRRSWKRQHHRVTTRVVGKNAEDVVGLLGSVASSDRHGILLFGREERSVKHVNISIIEYD